MNRTSTSTTPRSAADLRNQAKRLRFSADKLGTELLSPFVRSDAAFSADASTDAQRETAWAQRTTAVNEIRVVENCTPVELKTRLASMRAKADRLDSEAQEMEDHQRLEEMLGRQLKRRAA